MNSTCLKGWTTDRGLRQQLNGVIAQIFVEGPTRVVISKDGLAVPPDEARRYYDTSPSVVYIRDDGWSLGCDPRFDGVAFRMWKEQWVAAVVTERGAHPAMALVLNGVICDLWRDDPADMDE